MYTVTINGMATRVRVDTMDEALERALVKLYGRGYGFQRSSDEFYGDKSSQRGVLTRASKYGGATVEGRAEVSIISE